MPCYDAVLMNGTLNGRGKSNLIYVQNAKSNYFLDSKKLHHQIHIHSYNHHHIFAQC